MKRLFLGFIFLLQAVCCYSQIAKEMIVLDAIDDKPLIGANVVVFPSENRNTVTDTKGIFQINASATDSIRISFIGYNSAGFVMQNIPDTIYLLTKTIPLQGVIISADIAKKLVQKAILNLANKLSANNVSVQYELSHTDSVDNKITRFCNANMLLHIKGRKKNKSLKMDWYITKMNDKQIVDSVFYLQHSRLKDKINLNTTPPVNVLITESVKYDKQLLYELVTNDENNIVIHSLPRSRYRNEFIESYYYISANDTVLWKKTSATKIDILQKRNFDDTNDPYNHHIIERTGIYTFKNSSSGYYLDFHSFYMKFYFPNADFKTTSLHLQGRALSEPLPYQKEQKPTLKQRKVYASSYLFDY